MTFLDESPPRCFRGLSKITYTFVLGLLNQLFMVLLALAPPASASSSRLDLIQNPLRKNRLPYFAQTP